MAEPIGVASGIVALVAFAIQSSNVLYTTLDGLRTGGKKLRNLKEELKSLQDILQSLKETLSAAQMDLPMLEKPLQQCGKVCQDCTDLIKKCSSRSNGDRLSFRDLIQYTYKGKSISELQSLIAVYKSTITIALSDANIRQVGITVGLLQEYKKTIDETTDDLEDLLQQNQETSNDAFGDRMTATALETADPSDVVEERASIENCLVICTEVSKHLDEVQKQLEVSQTGGKKRILSDVKLRKSSQATSVTTKRLQDCQTEIGFTAAELRLQLQEVNHRMSKLAVRSRAGENGDEDVVNMLDFQEEYESIRECLAVCEVASEKVVNNRIHVFEDITAADEVNQIIVATMGDLISAKRVGVGSKSNQFFGQMSDTSLQHLSDRYPGRQTVDVTPQRSASPGQQGHGAEDPESKSQFDGRYGNGKKLN